MASFRMSSIQFMNNYKLSLNKTYQEQAKIMEQGDGTSIHRASDDPIGYSKLLRYTVSENENDQYHKNVDTAISWMKTSDSVVASIADRMKTFSEKTVAAANSYNTDADFQSIGKEMFSQIEEIVAEANTQQGDRYIFSGQRDTTEPFALSHDTYERGVAKTLDSKQAAFFKDASGDNNATLYQLLTIEYTNSDTGISSTYYLDTQSGYVYTKDFVDKGYKELIAQGYTNINEKDKLSTTSQKLARTYAAGSISLMTLSEAWDTVNSATEEELLQTIQALDINDGKQNNLRSALKVIADNDAWTVANNLSTAKSAVASAIDDVEEDAIKYNYTFSLTQNVVSLVNDPNTGAQSLVSSTNTPDLSGYNGVYSVSEYNKIVDYIKTLYPESSNDTTGESVTNVFSNTKGDCLTDVSWSSYDSDTQLISTDTTTVSALNWNNSSSYKNQIVNGIVTAIEDYAKNNIYSTTVTDSDSDTQLSDDIAQNVLNTILANKPASSVATGVPTDINAANISLAGNVTPDQVDNFAKAKLISLAVENVADYEPEKFLVSHAFTNRGLIHDAVEEVDKNDYVEYKKNANGTWSVTGLRVAMFSLNEETHEVTEGDKLDFKFSTVEQRMVTYMGDDNYISMVKMNGANDKSSDIVNLNGNDMFGCDIFDDANSGNEQSGCSMLNNMLTVYTFTNASDEHWLTSDGVTISDVSHATVTIAETTLGSRLNLYNSVAEMLDNQSTTITNDITNVSGTDVAELATRLMEMTTLYNMALALGGRVLPQSLADYL